MARTKAEIIEKLHGHGEMWANESYDREYLEDYLIGYEKAINMSTEELYAKLKAEGKLTS